MLEFDSMDEARQFYFSDGYTAAKLVREKASEADLILVEGFSSRLRRLTNFAGTAFNNIGFAHQALLMPVDKNGCQWLWQRGQAVCLSAAGLRSICI